jgi:hypothetical protein
MKNVSNAEILDFAAAQREKQQRWFNAPIADRFLAYVGSTSSSGTYARVAAHRLLGIERGATETELVVRLGGALPSAPAPGEIASVCVFDQYVGYQVKTRPGAAAGNAVVRNGAETTVRGAQVFTLHHGPYQLTAFEKVPLDEVLRSVGGARFALVGVGPAVNLSPRFCWHHEERDGRIVLFHGDGLPMKTFLNVKANPKVTRVLLDPETFEGYVGHGEIREVKPSDHPVGFEKICAGFANGGWGKPARVFQFVGERWERLAPLA